MIDNKLHVQFGTIDSHTSLTISCYHSVNWIILEPNRIKVIIGITATKSQFSEEMNYLELERHLTRFPQFPKIPYELLLHLFLSK